MGLKSTVNQNSKQFQKNGFLPPWKRIQGKRKRDMTWRLIWSHFLCAPPWSMNRTVSTSSWLIIRLACPLCINTWFWGYTFSFYFYPSSPHPLDVKRHISNLGWNLVLAPTWFASLCLSLRTKVSFKVTLYNGMNVLSLLDIHIHSHWMPPCDAVLCCCIEGIEQNQNFRIIHFFFGIFSRVIHISTFVEILKFVS